MFEEDKSDYDKLGFKSGLEIHQQLDTKKLFCNCPSVLRQDEPDFNIKRKLHAVAGESGEVDIAAKHEAEKEKNFVYEGYNTTCLLELDEIPPYEINKEALKIALQVAIMLNARIFPISQIMRKTVIDGSNTSGFQRTVLIARDGWVVTKTGRVEIQSICLEEDAARIIERKKDTSIYRLDRLGIPLIEIATSPDMKEPEQIKEVALYIGKILRSCKVKRGIGTIRQDINLSIKNGDRIEIKGFQDPAMMVKTIKYEIKRQLDLIEKGNRIIGEVRNALPDGTTDFLRPLPGAARMYPETDLPLLKISRELINDVKKNLPKLREDIEKDLEKIGLNEEMTKILLKQNRLDEFKELLEIYNEPNLIAKVLLVFPKEIASHEKKSTEEILKILNKDVMVFVAESLKAGKISKEQIKNVLERIVKGEEIEKAVEFKKLDMGTAEEKIMKIIQSKPGLSENAYMGLIMKELKGINARDVIEIIRKLLERK
ncbi:glutamyl-tRNA(Gln) amidotransferase subunit E [Candidatus Pacearchaeota archaeon RBG_19FT_COMBO_34_9]|nr:MAG: glutamyl-tRNA(Gln) amidotransferase subunit E [Candidatus Pacearchaeota archaeon RBG_19FT_COMBO_34_9]OGJ16567.1 MAG: glutamyl-tRNA(Gln) amidotransferase subunit E [Candidatus Pacearchaeota archaeon RBG_13_33_26]